MLGCSVLEAHWAGKGPTDESPEPLPFSHLSSGLDRMHAAKLFYQMCGESDAVFMKLSAPSLTISKLLNTPSMGCLCKRKPKHVSALVLELALEHDQDKQRLVSAVAKYSATA